MKFIQHSRWTNQPPREMTFEEVAAQVPEGWKSILERGFEEMFELGWDGNIDQIKEKFGSLRLYTSCPQSIDDDIERIIDRMERETGEVCCVCGGPKTKASMGWLLYYCDEHFPADKKEWIKPS